MSSTHSIRLVLAAALLVPVSGLQAQKKDVGYLRTRVDPHVAGVFVNGKYYGTVAMFGHRQRMIELAPGTYDVEIVDPRYKSLKVKAGIKAGETTTIRHSLEPLGPVPSGPFGELITEGFGNAAVYLEGKYYGNTAEFSTPGQSLLMKPGNYTMKIVPADGSAPREEKITLNADETLVISKTGPPVRRKQ